MKAQKATRHHVSASPGSSELEQEQSSVADGNAQGEGFVFVGSLSSWRILNDGSLSLIFGSLSSQNVGSLLVKIEDWLSFW